MSCSDIAAWQRTHLKRKHIIDKTMEHNPAVALGCVNVHQKIQAGSPLDNNVSQLVMPAGFAGSWRRAHVLQIHPANGPVHQRVPHQEAENAVNHNWRRGRVNGMNFKSSNTKAVLNGVTSPDNRKLAMFRHSPVGCLTMSGAIQPGEVKLHVKGIGKQDGDIWWSGHHPACFCTIMAEPVVPPSSVEGDASLTKYLRSIVLQPPIGNPVVVEEHIARKSGFLKMFLDHWEDNDSVPVLADGEILEMIMKPEYELGSPDFELLLRIIMTADYMDMDELANKAMHHLAYNWMGPVHISSLWPNTDRRQMLVHMDNLGIRFQPTLSQYPVYQKPDATADDFQRALLRKDIDDIVANYFPVTGVTAINAISQMAKILDPEGLLAPVVCNLLKFMDPEQCETAAIKAIEAKNANIFFTLVQSLGTPVVDKHMSRLLSYCVSFQFVPGIVILLRAGVQCDLPNHTGMNLWKCCRNHPVLSVPVSRLVLTWRAAVIGSYRNRSGITIPHCILVGILRHLKITIPQKKREAARLST